MALYAFDGTWNEDEADEGQNTNVNKFFKSYDAAKFYLEGVGTRKGFVGKVLGGVTGAGGKVRIREAIAAARQHFDAGDRTVDIIGFSRGAALALHFANELSGEFAGAEIRFLGLWDVVASFGLPGNDINLGWDLYLADGVKKCFHAMALDERRGNFKPTRVRARQGAVLPEGRLEEVWFRGVHSDVGGGQCIGLSSIALCWMMKRAVACGLPMDADALAQHAALRDAHSVISKNFDPKSDPPRRILPDDCVHETVQPLGTVDGRVHNDPPAGLRVIYD